MGPGRCPRGLRLYRRDAERTPWDAAVAKHCPELPSPREQTARPRLQPQVAPGLLQEPEVRARPDQVQTTIALAIDLVAEAIGSQGSVGVVGCDAWSLAEAWRRRRNKNRRREPASVQRRDVNGWAMKLPGPHLAVEALVPRLPATA
jgi:hypothetical protein